MTRHLSQCRPTPEPSPAWLESGWLFPEVEPFPTTWRPLRRIDL